MKEKSPYVLRSMTAYGRGVGHSSEGIVQAEIQCVNRRFLDIAISLPKELARFERELRKWVAEKIGRGQVSVRINWKREKGKPLSLVPHVGLAVALRNGWEEICTAVGLPLDREGLVALLTQREDLFTSDEEPLDEKSVLEALHEAIRVALRAAEELKRAEGEELARDIERKMTATYGTVDRIEKRAPYAVKKYGEKLAERLAQLAIDDKERWTKEVALFADKADISEEIVRLKSHLNQFLLLLHKPLKEETESRGKTLDFFLQELMRETNTIGAKAQDEEIIQEVVSLKGEFEKVREQLQNVE